MMLSFWIIFGCCFLSERVLACSPQFGCCVFGAHTRCRLLHGMLARILTHIFTIVQWRPMDRNGDAWTLLNMVQNILMCDIYICIYKYICMHTNIHWIDIVWPHFKASHFQKNRGNEISEGSWASVDSLDSLEQVFSATKSANHDRYFRKIHLKSM